MVYKHIKALREDHDIKQKELSKLLNVAQNTYSQYETGKIPWTDDILIQLAEFYHVSVDYLLDLTDEKAPYPKGKGQK